MGHRREQAVREIRDGFVALQVSAVRFLGQMERELGLSGPHLAALDAVASGATKVGDVAAFTRTHVSSASRAVDHLVEQDLVDRVQDPGDRRAVLLSLTKAGIAKAEALGATQLEMMGVAIADFSDDEVERWAQLATRFQAGMAQAFDRATD